MDRFMEMLHERGLSSYTYTQPIYSKTFGWYNVAYTDILKDGKVQATYNMGIMIEYFGEQCMARELDDLVKGKGNKA